MFKVNVYWDGFKYSESYHLYNYAVEAFESFDRISRARKADRQIDDYYVELIKED